MKEVKGFGLIISCVLYTNYNLSKEEQLLSAIDYINEYGFNIDRNLSDSNIIEKLWFY